jgi:hypothetical protein
MEGFKETLEKEIKAVSDGITYHDNAGGRVLRISQMGYEVEPPVTEKDKLRSEEINKELEAIHNFQNALIVYRKKLEEVKTQLEEVLKLKDT